LQGSGVSIDPATGQPLVDDNGNLVLGGTPLVSGTDEIFISRCLEANITRRSRKNTFTLNAGAEKRDFQDRSDDELGYGGSFRWQNRWGSGISVNSDLGYLFTRFDNESTEDRQWAFRVGVRKRVSRRLSVNLDYAFNQRLSTDADREYSENAVLLNFSYGLGAGGGGVGGRGFSGNTGVGTRVGSFGCSGGGSRSRGGAVTGGARSAINNTQSNFQ
jgi:hypothetical protein